MTTKSSNDKKGKQAARSKRATPAASGTGFGAPKPAPDSADSADPAAVATSSATPTPTSTSTSTSTSPTPGLPLASGKLEQVEDASGASGDATPHRVSVVDPTAALQDPSSEWDEREPEPLVVLPTLSADEARALRFDLGTPHDQVIEYLADASGRDDFAAIMVANRHLVTELMLYRFTSAILQVEGRATDIDSKDEEARNMRQLRKDIVAHCWSYDFGLKRAVIKAEARLLAVLQGQNVTRDVVLNCGLSRIDVNAFWLVVYAAVAAWEERGKENAKLVNVDTQRVLAEAAEACREVDAVKKFLSPCLDVVQEVLSSSDQERKATIIREMGDDAVIELGALTEASRLLPSQAYGGLAERLSSILDFIRVDKYNLKPGSVTPFRYNLQEIERGSRLVEFSRKSMKSRPNLD